MALVGLESSVREAVGGIVERARVHEDGGVTAPPPGSEPSEGMRRLLATPFALALQRNNTLPISARNMNDSPASDPEEAAIGRPAATARRLVEASVSPNTPRAYAGAAPSARRLARRPRAARRDPGRLPRRAPRRRPRLVERLDGGYAAACFRSEARRSAHSRRRFLAIAVLEHAQIEEVTDLASLPSSRETPSEPFGRPSFRSRGPGLGEALAGTLRDQASGYRNEFLKRLSYPLFVYFP